MTPSPVRGPIARGTIRTTFVLSLYVLVQAGTLLLVARMLGPHQFGAFAGVASLAVLLGTVSTFGTHIVLLGEVAKNPSRRDHVLTYSIPTVLLCGAVLLAIYLASCLLLLRVGVPWMVLLAIGATEIWLQSLFRLTVSEHQGLGRIARSQLLNTLPMSLRLAAAAGVFLAHPPNPLLAYGCTYPIVSLIALGLGIRTFPSAWPRFGQWRLPKGAELREVVGYAALTITATGPGELDKTLATKLLSLSAAGIYAASARAIVATTLPVNAMLNAALPRLFREALREPQRTTRLLLWLLSATLTYMLAVTAILWFAAPTFEWIFGAKYQGLGDTIRWLCLAAPGVALRMAAGTIMMALGKPWVRVGFETMGLLVLIVASIVLTTRFGTFGMPLALASSEWTMAVVGVALMFRYAAGSHPRPQRESQ